MNNLSISDRKTKIKYLGEQEKIEETTVFNFFINYKRNNGIFVKKGKRKIRSLACEDIGFMKWFDRGLNPHVNLKKLSRWDNKTIIYYRGNEGRIKQTKACTVFLNIEQNGGIFKENNRGQLAIDDPGFKRWFDQRMNPEINLQELKKNDNHTLIKYEGNNGKTKNTTVNRYFDNVKRNGGVFKDINYGQLACEDENFMKWYDQDLNSHININTLLRSNRNIPIYYRTDGGEIEHIYAYSYFQRSVYTGKKKPRKKHKHAYYDKPPIEMDPTLIFYWNEDSLELKSVSWKSTRKYHFICPFCGAEYFEYIQEFTMRIPKCSECKDGHVDSQFKSDEGIVVLYHKRTQIKTTNMNNIHFSD